MVTLGELQAEYIPSARQRARLSWPEVKDISHPKDVDLSLRVAEVFKAKPRRCWQNVFTALLFSQGLKVLYVEGFAIPGDAAYPGSRQPHGWLELEGAVIDPTWANDTKAVYFPGVKFTLADALTWWEKPLEESEGRRTLLPLVYRLGNIGLNHPDYMRALSEADGYGRLMWGKP